MRVIRIMTFRGRDELYYDDDNDDVTLFDKVQISTEQTLETLFNHIVK